MAEKKPSSREQVKQIVAQIENGIQELFQSERYADYLRIMSRFHTYSYKNQLLIHMQMPHAKLVAGFNKWKNQFGRHVKKGEKGITIIAPTPFKKRVEEMKLDPDTRAPMTDPDGNIIIETKEIEIPLYRPVKVFDVSQTEGRPLPSLASDLAGNVEQYDAFMEALRRTSPVPIVFKPLEKKRDGFFSPENQSITIREGMSQVQTVCAAVHEITHSILHNRNQEEMTAVAGDETKVAPRPKDENTEEVEAESVAYAVCQYFGIETGANSLGYIATWSKDRTLPELKSSLETISKTANSLITSIDRHFQEICKERGIELAERDVLESPSDSPERLVNDLLDLMDGLYREGLIRKNFPKDNREQVKANLVCAVDQDASVIRNVLNQFISENTGAESAKALLERLDALTAKPPTEKEYVYKMEVNPGAADRGDMHFIQAYERLGNARLNPEEILFVGSADQCQCILAGLKDGTIQRSDFVRVSAARISHYTTIDGARMDALVGMDDKVYLGRRDSYDNLGHYFNQDHSLLFLSDNEKMFDLISLNDYPLSQSELLERGLFTQEDFAEFAALQNGVLAQLVQTQPLLFDGKPFSLSQPDQPVMIPTEETAKDTTLDEYPMPDPGLTVSELEQRSGYQGGDLLPLSKELAMELLEQDFTIYAVERGENPEMLFDREDLDGRTADGMFAVPREEWEASHNFQQAVAERMDHQREREQAFLDHAGDCYAIYQVKDDESLRDIRFESTDWLKSIGRSVERNNYDLVYTGPLCVPDSVDATLDQLWYLFNNFQPADYQRPSMSVSDIVAVKRDGVVSCHYVDSVGFTALPGFFQNQPSKSAETVLEDSGSKPSVADLEAQVKAGQSISLMDLAAATHREREKKSVVAQLKTQPKGQGRKKTAPRRSAEREV